MAGASLPFATNRARLWSLLPRLVFCLTESSESDSVVQSTVRLCTDKSEEGGRLTVCFPLHSLLQGHDCVQEEGLLLGSHGGREGRDLSQKKTCYPEEQAKILW